MTLEIIEQELLNRPDSRIVLSGIDGVWEPDIHTLRINLKKSKGLVLDRDYYLAFPMTVYFKLDNEENIRPLFILDREGDETGLIWDPKNINILIDIVFPDSVVADIIPEIHSSDLDYLESHGKVISGNLLDLLSEKEISKFADKESWYRYYRISNDRSISSAPHIDKDGKIISQEYIYYKYSDLRIFFDGGKTRLFDLKATTKYIRLSGFAEREKYFVSGDSDPVLVGKEVVHIKEVPGLEIRPRNRDIEDFKNRFNYSLFTLYSAPTNTGTQLVPFITQYPRSFNFMAPTGDGDYLISNSVVFAGCSVVGDAWQYLEASTDLENYLIDSNPVFFLSGETKISFTVWNPFRASIIYDLSNVELVGDIASHFTLNLQSWRATWQGETEEDDKDGVLEVNLVSDGSDNLNGQLILQDTEDGSTIACIEVRTISKESRNNVFVVSSSGKKQTDCCIYPDSDTNGTREFYTIGASETYDKLQTKFFPFWDMDCGLVGNQGRDAWVKSEGCESDNIVLIPSAIFLGGEDEIDISTYPKKSIILYYDTEYVFKNPLGGFYYEPEDTELISLENGYSKLTVSEASGKTSKSLAYYLSSQAELLTETTAYFVKKNNGTLPSLTLEFSGFKGEQDKYLFGYLLVGFNLESIKGIVETSSLFPVYVMPSAASHSSIETMYDRNSESGYSLDSSQEISNAISAVVSQLPTNPVAKDLILGTGKTWIDLQLPLGDYTSHTSGRKTYIKYRVNQPRFSSDYIGIDQDKWRELYGSAPYFETDEINNSGSSETRSKVRIPIEIRRLPSGSHVQQVDIYIDIGSEDITTIARRVYLGPPVKYININDEAGELVDGDTIIHEAPINKYWPGRTNPRRGNGSISMSFTWGPAYNSAEYISSVEKTLKFSSLSNITSSDIKTYSGNTPRGEFDTDFSWNQLSSDNSHTTLLKTKSTNEYTDHNYHSAFVPEVGEYELIYRILKTDDYFPQYPSGKLSISSGNELLKNIFLFFLPPNPYKLATTSLKHYIVITDEQRAAWNEYINNGGTKPALIEETFRLSSNYFLLDGLRTDGIAEYDLNSEVDYDDYDRMARYLFHKTGLVSKVYNGDVYTGDKAFSEFTIFGSTDSRSEISVVQVHYKFDPSLWEGDETGTNNNVAEVFLRLDDPDAHRSTWPDDLTAYIGRQKPSWDYVGALDREFQTDYWSERYSLDDGDNSGLIYVPGNQEDNTKMYLHLNEEITTHSAHYWRKNALMPIRFQIKATNNPIGAESDMSASCYGGSYSWLVSGYRDADAFTISDPSILSISDVSLVITSSGANYVQVDLEIEPNINTSGFGINSRIEDSHYLSRLFYIRTNEEVVGERQYLNIEQRPVDSYFYYSSSLTSPKIYPGSWISDEPAVSEQINVGKEGESIDLFFEYLLTEGIEEFVSDNTANSFSSYINWEDRERVDWTDIDEGELRVVVSGDLNLTYTPNLEYTSTELGKVGRIILTIPENTADTSRAGEFKIVRRDNCAVLVCVSINQAGDEIVSYFSGSITSAGEGRLKVLSPYDDIEVEGPNEVRELGTEAFNGRGSKVYQVLYPESHFPDILSRAIVVKANGKEQSISLPQGFYGLQVSKTENEWNTEPDYYGDYEFGGSTKEAMESLDTRYYFRHLQSEPNGNDEMPQGSEVPFDIEKVKINNVKYKIISPSGKEYQVSDVFSRLSTDIVYSGTDNLGYPFFHTVGTVYEDKKELGLCLHIEFEVSRGYTSQSEGYPYYDQNNTYHRTPPIYSHELEAINKVQIWYKVN